MGINRNSPLPLYFQLKEILLGKIQQGQWKPGEQLPTEEEIQQEYDLSRTTVRQALRDLELEGRVTRQAGRGTFVAHSKIQEGTQSFNLEISGLQEQGVELEWRVISAEEILAPEEIARQVHVLPGTNIFHLVRLRLANTDPIGVAHSYVFNEFINKIDISLAEVGGSMNYVSQVGLDRCTAERIVEALPAEREEAKVLGIERGTPVLVITRVLRDPDARPVEFFYGVYRGDRFRYHIQSMPAQL